jgi:ABC-type multidrug transport system ATPase subunit
LAHARVRYGTRVALDDVTLSVAQGEIVGLLGPNGAGKSTTIDVLCGLRSLDEGSASVLGRDCGGSDRELRRSIGLVPQESGLYLDLNPVENLRLFARLYAIDGATSRIDELLTLFSLSGRAKDQVGTFSGGMRRRLALARALLHDPPVLLLDEPTLGVDVHGRRVLWDHITALRDGGRAVLVATNYLDEAAELCDRIVIIDEGRVLADASPAELRRRAGVTLVLVADDAPGLARALRAGSSPDSPAAGAEVVGGTVRVGLEREQDAAAVVAAAVAVTEVRSLRTEEPSLEDVFLHLTGRGLRE